MPSRVIDSALAAILPGRIKAMSEEQRRRLSALVDGEHSGDDPGVRASVEN
jgi:hypothetical protein